MPEYPPCAIRARKEREAARANPYVGVVNWYTQMLEAERLARTAAEEAVEASRSQLRWGYESYRTMYEQILQAGCVQAAAVNEASRPRYQPSFDTRAAASTTSTWQIYPGSRPMYAVKNCTCNECCAVVIAD